ncbi:MAG: hypothetical protein JRG86_15725 [Deltaproteobacteria bacterium]|jgi:hypothetical protein|nr:hypothetical protein [Deltaproteobacteria bacterium]
MIESSARYEPPLEHRVVVETVVNLPFDRAWDELIRRLSESAFRVATLERASRLVVVELDHSSDLALSANQPGRYVDCGRTIRTFADGSDEAQFDYAVVESSEHRESSAVDAGFRVSDVSRRVELGGRASLYLQPEGAQRTRVTVNGQYEVEFEISGTARVHPLDAGEPPGPVERFGPRVEAVRFSTFQPGHDQRRGGLTCRATGHLEHTLIALANPAAAI